MNVRFLGAVLLAVLVAVVWLGRSEDETPVDLSDTGRGGPGIELETGDPALRDGATARDSARPSSARERDPSFRREDGSSPAGDGGPRSGQSSRGRAASTAGLAFDQDRAEDEPDENRVIGGVVIDEDGIPLSGIEVLARRIDPTATESLTPYFDQLDEGVLSITSDAAGAFLFRGLEDGTYQLRIAPAEGIVPALRTVRVGLLNVRLEVVMLWDIRIHGTAASTDGKLLADVRINAGRQTRPARTGPKGEYEIVVSMQGVKRKQFVHFRRDGYRDERLEIDPDQLDFRTTELRHDVAMRPLAGRATVAGNLMDTDGLSVSGQILTLASSRLRTSYQAQSDRNGKYTFVEVEPGRDYRLQVRPRSGYEDKDINALEIPDRGLTLDIVLDPIEYGVLAGRMTDLNGNPVPGFAMNLHSRVDAGRSIRVVGDQRGSFLVEDFPVGEAVLTTNSYPVFSVQGLRVSAMAEEPVMIVLDTGRHVLQGQVTDGLGEAVAAASVLLSWTHNESGVRNASSRSTAADQDGNFVFTDLGPGVHRLQVSAQGFRTAVEQIDVGTHPRDFVVELQD